MGKDEYLMPYTGMAIIKKNCYLVQILEIKMISKYIFSIVCLENEK